MNRETHQSMFTRVGLIKLDAVVNVQDTVVCAKFVYKQSTVIAMLAHTSSKTSLYNKSDTPCFAFMRTTLTRYPTDATAADSATGKNTFIMSFLCTDISSSSWSWPKASPNPPSRWPSLARRLGKEKRPLNSSNESPTPANDEIVLRQPLPSPRTEPSPRSFPARALVEARAVARTPGVAG